MQEVIHPIGLERDEGHHYRWNGGPWMPGVTTVIKTNNTDDALINWAKKETAASAVRNHELVGTLIQTGGADSAIDWLKRIPDYIKDAAADMGSRVHLYAEMLAKKGELPEIGEQEMLRTKAYIDWENSNKPDFMFTEFMVFNPEYEYGGTGDTIFRLPICPAKGCGKKNCVWLVDYKTSNYIFPKSALQLSGLVNGHWIGEPGTEVKTPLPAIDHFGILHITNLGARLVEYVVGDEEWEAFKACRILYKWNTITSKNTKVKP